MLDLLREEPVDGPPILLGVHLPRFDRERELAHLERWLDYVGADFPVLFDEGNKVARRYGVTTRPTVVVVGPDGRIEGASVGEEGCFAAIETAQQLCQGETAERDSFSTPRSSPAEVAHRPLLRRPTAVATGPAGELAVCDTGNDRVLLLDSHRHIEAVLVGLSRPRGVALDEDTLVVSDTGNDRIVMTDRRTGATSELVSGLASPTGVLIDRDGSLVVSESAGNRLWRVDDDGRTSLLAGTGEENIVDGPAHRAALGEPVGLARAHDGVVFADASTSAVRILSDRGRVGTFVGEGLYESGLVDGKPRRARLAHPRAVAIGKGEALFVADTFNDRIRMWRQGQLRTLPLTGLIEPEGITAGYDNRLIIADTGHDHLVAADPSTGGVGLIRLVGSAQRVWVAPAPAASDRDALVGVVGSPLRVPIDCPDDHGRLESTSGPPVSVTISADPPWLLWASQRHWSCEARTASVQPTLTQPGAGTLDVDVRATATAGDRNIRVHRRTRHHLVVDS